MVSQGMSIERLKRLTELRDQRNHARGDRLGSSGPGEWCVVILRHPETGERRWELLQWGLIPHWAKDRASPHLHARSETIHELPSFRDAFAHRRCLVVAGEFVEHRTIGQPKGQAVAFGLAAGGPMAIAAIWDIWRDPETGDRLRTFAEATTDANDLVGEMHDRMPCILPRETWSTWLGEEPASERELRSLLRPYPSELLTCWPAKGKRPPPGSAMRPDQMKRRPAASAAPRQATLL